MFCWDCVGRRGQPARGNVHGIWSVGTVQSLVGFLLHRTEIFLFKGRKEGSPLPPCAPHLVSASSTVLYSSPGAEVRGVLQRALLTLTPSSPLALHPVALYPSCLRVLRSSLAEAGLEPRGRGSHCPPGPGVSWAGVGLGAGVWSTLGCPTAGSCWRGSWVLLFPLLALEPPPPRV